MPFGIDCLAGFQRTSPLITTAVRALPLICTPENITDDPALGHEIYMIFDCFQCAIILSTELFPFDIFSLTVFLSAFIIFRRNLYCRRFYTFVQ